MATHAFNSCHSRMLGAETEDITPHKCTNSLATHISCYMHRRGHLTPSFQPGSLASDLSAPENDMTTQEFRIALLSKYLAIVCSRVHSDPEETSTKR